MGNTVPPRMCREAASTAVGRRRRPSNAVVPEAAATAAAPPAAPRCGAAVDARKQRRPDGVAAAEEDVSVTLAGRRRGGGGGAAGTAVTVKIVLKRKDAEALVARLDARNERERRARMAELKGGFRAGGGASPAPCRDAWRPMLAPIQEN